jgi:periplasmic protein TonB
VGRAHLIALSLGAHAVGGILLGSMPARKHTETIAISIASAPKPKAPSKVEPSPEPEPPRPSAALHPVRAKAAPASKPAAEVPAHAEAAPSLTDALPDFGLSMSGGGSGVAVPSARGPIAAAAPVATSKTLTRAVSPRPDDCADPPGKPRLVSRPTPAYTAEAQAAGVSGKVRVEITVDEHGRVVSVRLVQGLGHGLDEAALAAARGMTFEAAVRCGKPAAATFKVGFTFAPPAP